MKKIVTIKRNSYADSVTLMSISAEIKKTEGISEAVISMGTPMNKELLKKIGLNTPETEVCTENDLIIAFSCEEDMKEDQIFLMIEKKMKGSETEVGRKEAVCATIEQAVEIMPGANLAVISVPGEHAGREARKALSLGMNVMLFSDNVTLEEEKELKEFAHEKELLLMGPDCGTAMINGTGLCFTNRVNTGGVGLAGASGTGMQEIMVMVDRLGGGISNAFGVGGRDLSESIGGIMMTDVIRLLQADEKTKVIVVVSKAPDPNTEMKLFQLFREEISKPVILCFTSGLKSGCMPENVSFGASLTEAAQLAVEKETGVRPKLPETGISTKPGFSSGQKYIRGLYCGGTLCQEAYYRAGELLGGVHSNLEKNREGQLKNAFTSEEHTFLDLGDDLFTQGRPHPMIDPTIRTGRILEECRDKTTAVIILDFELGYGSHENPAGATVEAIYEGIGLAKKDGREIAFVIYVCGTDKDGQNKRKQEEILIEAGCIVAQSNIDAVNIACGLILDREEHYEYASGTGRTSGC